MATNDKVRQHLNNYAESDLFSDVSETEILQAENELSLSFPEQLRALIRDYGAILTPSREIFGLGPATSGNPPFVQNIVSANLWIRENRILANFSNSLLAISEDGFGGYYLIETAAPNVGKIYEASFEELKLAFPSINEFILSKRAADKTPHS